MKFYIGLAACAMLAACGGATEEEAAPAEAPEQAAAPSDEAMAAASGTYELTMDDGTVTIENLNADGTYSSTVGGEQTETGMWRLDGDNMCFDPEGEEAEMCWGSTQNADGSFTVLNADGSEAGVTGRRIEAE